MSKGISPQWQHLLDWWQENKDLYNVPAIAARAELYKGRVYAALNPGSQGGSTAKHTDELYEKLTAVLGNRYQRYKVPTNISVDEIHELYEVQGFGLERTAKELGVTMPTLRRYMRQAGIPSRPAGATSIPLAFDAEQLRAFIRRNNSQESIIEQLRLTNPLFLRQMNTLGLNWQHEVSEWRGKLWEDIRSWCQGRQKSMIQLATFFPTRASLNRAMTQSLPPIKPILYAIATLFSQDGFTSPHYEPAQVLSN